MKTKFFILFILSSTCLMFSQDNRKETKFEAHQNLIGGTWKLNATWNDGSPHKLHIEYRLGLNDAIIKTKTYGNIKEIGYEFGLRNEGIRYLSNQTGLKTFYEFDVFGSLTKGDIKYDGKNIYYTYEYFSKENKTVITDGWEFIDSDTYNYSIGIYDFKAKKWVQKFLNAQIKRF